MKKVLLINGYEIHEDVGENRLNQSLTQYAKEILEKKGYEVSITNVTDDYNPMEEHDKILEADIVFAQTPIYWFSVPGAFKTYIDRVFIIGFAQGTMCKGDGRTRTDPSKRYGCGGVLTDKHYMVSTTWNAPEYVFNDEDEFMDGLSLDESTVVLHKTFQLCGMNQLPSFGFYDVFKDGDVVSDIEKFKKHVEENF